MINSNKATSGFGSFDDCCFGEACGKIEVADSLQFQNSKEEQEKKLSCKLGNNISKSANDELRNSPFQDIISPFMKVSPILSGNSSDYSLSDCLSSANTHFSASISKQPASESCENISESLQVLLSSSEINTGHSIPGKFSQEFDTQGGVLQTQEEQVDQQGYPKVSIMELESKGISKSDSMGQQGEQGIDGQARIYDKKSNETEETIRKEDIVDKNCYFNQSKKDDQRLQSDSRDQEVQMNKDNNIAPSNVPDENNQRSDREGEQESKYQSEQDQRRLTEKNNQINSKDQMVDKDEQEESDRNEESYTNPYETQDNDQVKENDDPFRMIIQDDDEVDNDDDESTTICKLQIDSEVLEQIQQIDRQEDEDESVSPTLRLHRVILSSKNSIEERIFQWLDKEGVIQVDPSLKREEYYNQKRDNLIGMRSLAEIPSSNSQIGSSSSIFGEMKMSSLRLCKITSSPLFNRRKLGREEGHVLQLQKVETTGKSYSQPIKEEDEMILSTAGDGRESKEDDKEENTDQPRNENLGHLSKFCNRAVLEGDSEEDPQDQLIQRIAELQVEDSRGSRQLIVPTLEIHRNLKRISLKLIHSPSSNSPAGHKEGMNLICYSSNSIINKPKNYSGNPSTFNLNRKNTYDVQTTATSTRTKSKEKSMIKLAS